MRRPRISRILFAAVGLIAACQVALASAQAGKTNEKSPTPVSLCQLGSDPKHFRGDTVDLKARFETVVIEGGMWLYDDSCPQYGLQLLIPAQVRNHPENYADYTRLEDAFLRTGSLGTADKTVIGHFTGKLVKSTNQLPLAMIFGTVDDLSVRLDHK